MKDNGKDVGTQQSHPPPPMTQKAGGTSGAGLTPLPEPLSSPNRRRHNGQRGLKDGGWGDCALGKLVQPLFVDLHGRVKPPCAWWCWHLRAPGCLLKRGPIGACDRDNAKGCGQVEKKGACYNKVNSREKFVNENHRTSPAKVSFSRCPFPLGLSL